MRERPVIQGRGQIVEILPHNLYRVRMANGFEPRAHLDRSMPNQEAVFEVGQEVELRFSAYDMYLGRIVEA